MLWSQGSCSACISTGLSRVGFGLRRLEEGVGQLPEPHGHSLGDVGRLGVHDGVEKRLQVGLRVPSDVHDLVSGRGGLRRRLGPRGCRLPRPGRRALPRRGLRGRLPLALGGRLRRRLLPGIHGSCLPDAHPDQAGEGSARAPLLDGPGREERRGRRARGAALGGGRDAVLALRAGGLRGGPASPAPAPPPPPRARLRWSGGRASGGAAREPDPRRRGTFPPHCLDGCRTAGGLSPPPFSFTSFSCSFLPSSLSFPRRRLRPTETETRLRRQN